ncbi:hypothetical protein L9F63_026173, partial [Diploptera punctata]
IAIKANAHDFFDVEWLMYVVYFATHPDYLNQGIGTETLRANFELANMLLSGEANIIPFEGDTSRSPAVEAIAGVFTTPRSQKIASTLDWEKVKEFYYINLLEKHKRYIQLAGKIDEDNETAICMGKSLIF